MKYLGGPQPERGGFGLLARLSRDVNRLKEAVRSLSPAKAPNLRLTHTAFGVARTHDPRSRREEGGATVKRVRFHQMFGDYMVCQELDDSGSPTGETINVAKAWELRKSTTHNLVFGLTIEPYPGSPGIAQISYEFPSAQFHTYRIAHMGTAVEHQVIEEHYIVDGTILSVAESENGTGVSDADEWQDLNVGGHAWARVG